MRKKVAQDNSRSLTREEVVFCMQLNPARCCLSLMGEPWDETEAPQLSHSHFFKHLYFRGKGWSKYA